MRRMRPRLFAASAMIILGSALAAGAGQAGIDSAWTDKPVTIDGLRNDWESTPLADWKKDVVSYAFRNDGETLYILLVIQDPKYRSSIDGTGITLCFDARSGKSKDYGILFKRIKLNPMEYIAYLEKRVPVSDEQREQIRQKPGFNLYHHQVLDRKGKPVEDAGQATATPAVFKYASAGKAVVYEFSVPLRRVSELVAGVGAAPGGSIEVGFEWGGETEAMRKAAAKRLREQADIANEDTDRGDPQIVGSVKSGPSPKKVQFWTTVKLASGPR